MVLIVFRARMRPGAADEALNKIGERMYELATGMPGFVSYKDFSSSDGEAVTVVEFESHETRKAWRNHPEHLQAQAAGRERYFSEYSISVCDVVRSYNFKV